MTSLAAPRVTRTTTTVVQVPFAARLALRALPFLALAVLSAAHWAALVEPHQTRRAIVVALVVTVGGLLINLSGALPRAFGIPVRFGLVILMAFFAVSAIGIRMKLLLPAGWHTLDDRVSGGLAVVGSVTEWPYHGPNAWLRLTTLLAIPLVLLPASVLAFWPHRRPPGALHRAAPPVLLVALYAVAVAARPFDHQVLRGIALLACLAAWIWLPRLTGREARGALLALVVVGAAAALVMPKLASDDPWVDYHHWSWTLHHEKTVTFNWQPSYGPLVWPRKGTTLLLIRARHPHYWKAETLDHFGGIGWGTTNDFDPTITQLQISGNPDWTDTARVTVRGFKSQLVIAPGTPLTMHGLPSETIVGSAATYLTGSELRDGNSYSVTSYTPDPSAKQMRAAQQPPDQSFVRFTTLTVPRANGYTNIVVPFNTNPAIGDPGAAQVLEQSRYAPVYALARRVAKGARTQYDLVQKVGSYLEAHYVYSERVPSHALPLLAFLLRDKRGYCQHFAGAAALMLRMLGVPTRVATGFAPGTRDSQTHEFVVRDLDAHSWIEVWFQGIGWVPFDPTPAQAPAASRATSFGGLSGIASAARGDFKDTPSRVKREPVTGSTRGGDVRLVAGTHHTAWGWVVAGAVFGLLALAALAVSVSRRRLRRRPLPAPCGDAEIDHLVRLLVRLGLEVDPGTTLLELEQRLDRLGGPDAAGYAERLRRRRYGVADKPPPGRTERRKLRQALASAIGAGWLARLQLAMPDNLLTRPSLLRLPRTRRTA